MSTNPYAPPKAVVADVAPVGAAATPVFFPVGRKKLIVMLFVTFTLYELVWFYKNWALVRERGEPVMPLMRAIFAVFFCYDLFSRVRSHGHPAAAHLPAGLLATGWIVFTVAGNLLDRLISPETFPAVYAATLVVLFASVFFLVPVQNAVNAINRAEAPDHDPNERFTALNWVWIVVGGLLLVLSAIGTLVPTP
jgi:hypothetical protein